MHSCVFSGNVEMVSKGSISMLDCTLVNKTDHVVLARDVSRALILGGIASSAVESHSLGDVQVDPVPVAALPAPPMPVLPPDPRPAKPLLFNVMDYGAVADGQSVTPADNTKAFQKALAAAGKAGGGTVYVPGGFYVLAGSLTVPTGVELRGCFDAPHHTQSKGTVLFPTGGRGQDHGTPLISLSPGSGVRGLTVYYPDQKMDQITPYPWTFRSLGPRCWIMDIATANAYRLADFGTYPSEGHLIRYVMGFPLKSGLWVSKGSGVVDGCHFNPHFWGRRYKGAPNPTSSPSVTEKDAGKFIDEQIFNHEENYVFGSCPNELIVNLATCPGGLALAFIADGAGATGALVMNQESDSTTSPLHVEAASKSGITLYNTVLAPVDLTQDAQAISIAPSCKGNVLLCNGMTWIENKKPAFALLGSGRTVMHNWLLGQDDIVAGNGSVVLQGMMCRTSAHDDVQVVSPMKQLLLNGDSSGSDVFTYPLHSASVEARGNAKLAPSIPLKDSFVTGFEKGQPQPTPHVVAVYEMKSTDCQVVPGAGRDGGAGLVLTASPIIEGKHAAVVYELFLPRGVVIGKDTLFRFWLKPDTDVARTTVLGLTYTDGSNGVPPDTTGRIMHPMTPRGAAGKWTRIECWLGSFAAGKTLRSIQTIFDFANPSADCRCTFDDIEIGEPIKPIGQ